MEEPSAKINWSFRAMDELSDIREYLVEVSSEKKADSFVDELLEVIQKLENNSEFHGFCPHPKLQEKGYRCIRFKNYLVIYFVLGNTVQIIAIMHAKRNPKDFDALAE